MSAEPETQTAGARVPPGPDAPVGAAWESPVRGAEAYVAELIGTFLLVFFICAVLSVFVGGLGYADFAVIGLLHFLLLSMLVYTLGDTSGAHFNPAVTVALTAIRKIRPVEGLVYILVQLAGGVAGALVCRLLLSDEGAKATVHYGATTISPERLQGKALGGLLAEFLGTFVLMWAIMGTAVNPRADGRFAGLVIGGTLGFAVMTFGPLTGAGFNPARSFGPALVSGQFPAFWVYVVGPVLGALAAALVYRAVVLVPAGRVGERPVDTLP